MKIAFIYGKFPSSWLTQLFTGSSCYHVAFVDEEVGAMYDMNLLRRKRRWPHYPIDKVKLVECPVPVPLLYLEAQLLDDEATYGYADYLLFALRPLYHLLGFSTRNKDGVICSEMIYNDLVANGWEGRFREVPSPADLERVLCP